MKYYLIDYENVNAAGLEGIDDVSSDSRVVLFYTKNSSKIDLGVFNLLRSTDAELAVIEVHHGKQALDIQLASYVGFLIGTEPADTEYYIVSKDKGYRNIQDFWSDRHIVLCTSLREDSEIIDEPKPARSSRSGRSKSSSKSGKSDAKAGKSDTKNSKSEAKAEQAESKQSQPAAKNEDASHEERHAEGKSSGRKGIRTKAEKNTKREKHEKVDLTEAVHPAGEAKDAVSQADEAPAEAAPVKEETPEEKPAAPNAFAEAAALAAAMAAAKSEGTSESNAILTTSATAPAEEPADDKTEEAPAKSEKKASKSKKSSSKSKKTAKAETNGEKEESKTEKTKEKSGKSKSKAEKTEAKSDKAESKSGKKSSAKNGGEKQKISEQRNEVNTEIQKILSKEGFPGDVINTTASFVSKNYGKDGYKQTIYRGIIKDHGQKQGLAIYRLIKGVL